MLLCVNIEIALRHERQQKKAIKQKSQNAKVFKS